MRLRIVLSSLAVMVLSPIVAFSGTTPEAASTDPGARAAVDALPGARAVAARSADTVRRAASAVPGRRTARRVDRAERAPAGAPTSSEISVACGQDACVIQDGLEITVSGGGAGAKPSR